MMTSELTNLLDTETRVMSRNRYSAGEVDAFMEWAWAYFGETFGSLFHKIDEAPLLWSVTAMPSNPAESAAFTMSFAVTDLSAKQIEAGVSLCWCGEARGDRFCIPSADENAELR